MFYRNVCKFILNAQEQIENGNNSDKRNQKNTVLCQLLERRDKFNLKLEDFISIMTDLIIGGVDTVTFSKLYYKYKN